MARHSRSCDRHERGGWAACALIISRKQALRVGVSRLADDYDESNVNLPHVRNKQRESRFALVGMVLLVIGFLLQIAGSWSR